jgi:hypothetical protein
MLFLSRLLRYPWKKERGAILIFCPRHQTRLIFYTLWIIQSYLQHCNRVRNILEVIAVANLQDTTRGVSSSPDAQRGWPTDQTNKRKTPVLCKCRKRQLKYNYHTAFQCVVSCLLENSRNHLGCTWWFWSYWKIFNEIIFKPFSKKITFLET